MCGWVKCVTGALPQRTERRAWAKDEQVTWQRHRPNGHHQWNQSRGNSSVIAVTIRMNGVVVRMR